MRQTIANLFFGRRCLTLLLAFILPMVLSVARVHATDVFIYSSQSTIRGLDLSLGTDRLLTTSPFAAGVNALAYNLQAGIVYYGNDTSVYRWNPALGSGAGAHVLMNDFSVGPLTAPITNINSTAGSYLNGKYYVGSESNTGYIQDIYELTMSIDGTQVVSVRALNLLDACACTEVQLGGFGDVAAIIEGGTVYLYGSSADLSGTGQGTSAGRWKFSPDDGSFQLLSSGSGGQMSVGPSGTLYSNVGNSVREVDKVSGAISGTSLITTAAAIYDFTGGFSMDYGDAPDSYGSAFHRLSQTAGARIGALAPDNEPGSLNAVAGLPNGLGDDTNGVDDEDAVSSTLAISAQISEYSLTVQCSAGARVAGWIDSNINGLFDTSERNFNHPVTCTAGQAELRWSGLLGASAGNSYMRLRTSINASAVSRPTGIASDGEVEDHPIIISGGSASSGSCPANSTSHVYSATDLPIAIGPNANTTAVSTISVSETGALVDVNVLDVTGTHTYINDLYFDLRHDGVNRRLYGPSCGSQNNFSFGFDDSASGIPPCPPIDGNSYPPQQSLDSFNGQDASGDWQLLIVDRFNGDAGSLSNWQLELCTSGNVDNETPDIVLAKHADVDEQRVSLQFTLRNTGNVQLDNVSIDDDLDAVFGAGNYVIVTPPVVVSGPAGAIANAAYNGSSVTELLGSTVVLPVAEQLIIELGVSVNVIAATADPGRYANQAQAQAQSPTGALVADLSGPGLDVSSDTDDPTVFQIDASATLSGYVFFDTSPNQASAHDGIKDSVEIGTSGRLVQILDSSNMMLASVTTDASGFWQVSLAPVHLNQSLQVVVQDTTDTVFVSEAPAYTIGSVTDGTLQTSATYAQNVLNINSGVISRPSLNVNQSSSVNPNDTVVYSHTFTASTHGVVDYSVAQATTPIDSNWSVELWRDNNCDGLLDAADTQIAAPATIVKDEVQCLLTAQTVPANTGNGAIAQTLLTATLSVSDEALTGHNVQFATANTDTTTVVRVGAGRLELEKSVRNISTGGVAVVNNAARPGHTLEYSILYRNAGDGPLTELLVQDGAPPFTTIQSGTSVCASTPASLTCVPDSAGASVSWNFTGILAPGESGLVSYRVVVD